MTKIDKAIGALMIVASVLILVWAINNSVNSANDRIETEKELQELKEFITYEYVVTDIAGYEIYSRPLNKISESNQGLLLFDYELDFKVNEGDKIAVIYGEYEDEFYSIELIERGK